MNNFTNSVSKIFKGALTAFKTFPVSIGCALAFAIVAIIRVRFEWVQQDPASFLIDCISWGLALGAIFDLAAITAVQSRYNKKKMFTIANILTIVIVAVTILLLFFFGDTKFSTGELGYTVMSSLSAARVSVAILISLIAFIIFASYPKDKSDFSQSFFMIQKSFFIAMLYGLVIMAGSSGVAGAIQALLYPEMSGNVYAYIGTISGFLAFTIFVGYLPDFRKGESDAHREVAQKHPRFIEVLFEYIMIPIMIALTLVLLLWSGKTIMGGMKASFMQLFGIATAYTMFGLWLHLMVTHYKTGLASFYRKVYPFAAVVILAIEARALVIQILKSNLKTTEYLFIVIWIIALASAVLLIILNEKSHKMIAILICIMAIITVLPVVGYRDLPVTMQVNRLEKLLNREGMIENNQLIPAKDEPDLEVRESISDAVNYLAYVQDAKLPIWFDPHFKEQTVFKDKFGFEQVWPNYENLENEVYLASSLILPSEGIDISEYQWAINLSQEKTESEMLIKGNKGDYQFYWEIDQSKGLPTLKILLNDKVILEKSMQNYIDKIVKLYPASSEDRIGTLKDMSLKLETPEIKVLIVFRNITINTNRKNNETQYWLEPNALYMKER